jgi:hypothetical protein
MRVSPTEGHGVESEEFLRFAWDSIIWVDLDLEHEDGIHVVYARFRNDEWPRVFIDCEGHTKYRIF